MPKQNLSLTLRIIPSGKAFSSQRLTIMATSKFMRICQYTHSPLGSTTRYFHHSSASWFSPQSKPSKREFTE